MKNPTLRPTRGAWLFAGAAALLAIVFYRDFIFAAGSMLYGDDMVNEGFQLRSFGVHEILAGRGFPFWNPFVYGGQPYLAILPGPVFYPTTLLYLAMPLHRAIGWTFVVHTFLGGLFGYLAARSIGLRPTAACVSGLAFMFAGFVVSTLYGGHDGRMFAMVLIPLAFALLERGLASGRPEWFVGLGLVVALQIFTPHIQLMYYSSLALTLYAALRIGGRAREEGGRRLAMRLVGWWAVAFLVAGLVGAAQLLPTVRILDVAVRGGAGESGYAFASSWALPPQEITALFLPDLIGSLGTYWGTNPFKLHTEYMGAVPIGLAVIALTSIRRDRRVLHLSVVWLACLLFALGAVTPVHRVAYHLIPFVARFRAPAMMLGPASLVVALLAGVGWDRVLRDREEGATIPWFWVALLGVPLVGFGLAAALGPEGLLAWVRTAWYPAAWSRGASVDPIPALRIGGWLLLGGVGGTVGGAWAVARGRLPAWSVFGLLAFIVVDGWHVDSRYLRTVDPDAVFPSDPVIEQLQDGLAPGERVFPVAGLTDYRPSELSVHGIPSVTGIQKFRLEWYERFTGGLGMRNVGTSPALALLDVGYIVAGSELTAEVLTPVAEGRRGTAYRVTPDVPHAFFPRSVAAIPDTAAALRRILSADPLDLAVVESTPAPAAGEGAAQVRSLAPNEIVLDVSATRGGLLYVSEVYYPAWKAWLDDVPVDVLRTNVAFRGVVVPEGEHELRMRYEASEFRLGFALSGLTAAAALVGLVACLVQRRRRRPAVSSSEERAE